MTRTFLFVNAILYILFALWCTVAPTKTAEVVGLAFRSGSGKSEYITVYGGLEFGVAMFFLVAALRPELRDAGLLFGLLFYAGLVVWRIPGLLTIPGIAKTTYFFAGAEFLFGVWALVLWLTRKP
jgi:hypothetical protein